MVKVVFYPGGHKIQAQEGATLLDAARLAGVTIDSPCGGLGTCRKCKVRLRGKSDLDFLLSCQTKISSDLEVEVSARKDSQTMKILSQGRSSALERDSFVRKIYNSAQNSTKVTAGEEILGIEPGDTEQINYGIVVDIGTTTLVVALVDINKGTEIASASALNPQALHAQDVLSRIKIASEEAGLASLHSILIAEINRLIAQVTKSAGVSPRNIYEAVFSGNTCMLHLAARENPASLGRFPYTPGIRGGHHLPAAQLHINIAAGGLIYLPPIISAYVGADITSGLLAAQLCAKDGVTLFIDIGTNGEIVIGFDGRLTAASTAAGPAFEGMNITYGMRAADGAIEYFNIEEDGEITVGTIGGSKAAGICGSGLLDIAGELVAHGIIHKNGKFADPGSLNHSGALQNKLVFHNGKPAFQAAEGIYFTQKDIRQVQLAKGAIRVGIEFLLAARGVKAADVDRVLIAGSFGYHLRAKSLINIGLLPREFAEKIDFVGNTSLVGGRAFLLNKTYRGKMQEIVEKVNVLELANNYQDFDRAFVRSMGF